MSVGFGVINATSFEEKDPRVTARQTLISQAAGAGILVSHQGGNKSGTSSGGTSSGVPGTGDAGPFISLPRNQPPAPSTPLWRLIGVVTRRFSPKENNGRRSAALRVWDAQSGICETSANPHNVHLIVLVGAAFERWFSHLVPRVVVAIGPATGTPEVTHLANNSGGGGGGGAGGTQPAYKIVVNNPGDIVTIGLSENITTCGAHTGRSNDAASSPLCEIFVNHTKAAGCTKHLMKAMKEQRTADLATKVPSRALTVPKHALTAATMGGRSISTTPTSAAAAAASAAAAPPASAKSTPALPASVLAGKMPLQHLHQHQQRQNQLHQQQQQQLQQRQNQLSIVAVQRNPVTNRVGLTPQQQKQPHNAASFAALIGNVPNAQQQQQQQGVPTACTRTLEHHDFQDPRKPTLTAHQQQQQQQQMPTATIKRSIVSRTVEAAAAVSAANRKRERDEQQVMAPPPPPPKSASSLSLNCPNALLTNVNDVVPPKQKVFAALPDAVATAKALRGAAPNAKTGLAASLGLPTNFREMAKSQTSENDDCAKQAAKERTNEKLRAIEQKAAVFEALDNVAEVPVQAYHCAECCRLTFVKQPVCVERGHKVTMRQTVKRFYRCSNCKQGRMPGLGETVPVSIPCRRCGATRWERTSAAGGVDAKDLSGVA